MFGEVSSQPLTVDPRHATIEAFAARGPHARFVGPDPIDKFPPPRNEIGIESNRRASVG